MNEKLRSAQLSTRVITAVILVLIVCAAWCFGKIYLSSLIALICLIGIYEFTAMFLPSKNYIIKGLSLFCGAVFLALLYFFPEKTGINAVIPCVLIMALYALTAWSREKSPMPLKNASIGLGSLLYMPLLFGPIMHFSAREQIFILIIPILSDISAYFAGILLGRHTIWAAVSPKKTIEGALAGLIISVAAATAMGFFFGKAPLLHFAVIGLILAVMSQLGDFFESALKRAAGVKDSGRIFPGHGGVLDRTDSMIFVCGTYAFIVSLFPLF